MHTCILCNTPLLESNQTVEHIVPASLGGSLESEIIICRNCNSRMGEDLDCALLKALQILVVGFDIVNAREPSKGVRPLRYVAPDGMPLVYVPGSSFTAIDKHEFHKEQKGDFTHISFEVPLGANYERLVAKQMDALKRHYGEDNIIKVETEEEICVAPHALLSVQAMYEEPEFLRAVTRIAWSFACDALRKSSISEPDYSDICAYVLGNTVFDSASANTIITGYPIGSQKWFDDETPPKHLLACTAVNGTLWSAVVLFGSIPFLVRIADTPRLPSMFQTSCILDPENRTNHNESEFGNRLRKYLLNFNGSPSNLHEMVQGTMRAAVALNERGKDAKMPPKLMRAYLAQAVSLGLLSPNVLIAFDAEHNGLDKGDCC